MQRVRIAPFLLLLGCTVETSGLLPGSGSDSGSDAGRADATASDATSTDAPMAEVDAGPMIDAGPPMPTTAVTLATSGTVHGHPAVTWTGSDFAVAFLDGDGTGAHVDLVRMPPGAEPGDPMRLTTELRPRRSLTVASNGASLAVGWVEEESGTWTLEARTVPPGTTGRFGPVQVQPDYDDAHLVFDGSTLFAAVRQQSSPSALASVEFGATVTARGHFAWGDFGELASLDAPSGPAIVMGSVLQIWQLRSGTWSWAGAVSLGDPPVEGDLATLSDGSLVGVWSVMRGGGRHQVSVQMDRTGDVWSQLGPARDLGWEGPDPSVGGAGDHVVVAWADTTDGARTLGLAMLDAAGAVVVDRCHVMPERAVANDPDIACGAGYCAVVWIEADRYDAADFRTRVIQVPAVPTLVCP